MAKTAPFLVHLDMNQNQLLNALLQVLATDPATSEPGQVWYRSDTGAVHFRSSGTTRRLAELVASGAVNVTYNADGTVTVAVTKATVDALGIDAATVDGMSASEFAAAIHDHAIGDVTGLQAALDAKLDDSQKGVADGLAELDATAKLPVAQLPDVALGGLSYQGTWDAATNWPTLNGTTPPEAGVFYKVSAAGSTNLSGITDWNVGDWAISDGTNWQKLDNTDQVLSVAGRTGAITLGVDDIDGLQAALDEAANTYAEVRQGVTGPITVVHNLRTDHPSVTVWDFSTNEIVECNVTYVDENTISVDFNGTQSLVVRVVGQ